MLVPAPNWLVVSKRIVPSKAIQLPLQESCGKKNYFLASWKNKQTNSSNSLSEAPVPPCCVWIVWEEQQRCSATWLSQTSASSSCLHPASVLPAVTVPPSSIPAVLPAVGKPLKAGMWFSACGCYWDSHDSVEGQTCPGAEHDWKNGPWGAGKQLSVERRKDLVCVPGDNERIQERTATTYSNYFIWVLFCCE